MADWREAQHQRIAAELEKGASADLQLISDLRAATSGEGIVQALEAQNHRLNAELLIKRGRLRAENRRISNANCDD